MGIKTAAKYVGGYSHVTFLPEFFFSSQQYAFLNFQNFLERKKKKKQERLLQERANLPNSCDADHYHSGFFFFFSSTTLIGKEKKIQNKIPFKEKKTPTTSIL